MCPRNQKTRIFNAIVVEDSGRVLFLLIILIGDIDFRDFSAVRKT